VKGHVYTWSSQAWSLLYIIAAPRLLAGLMPVPVIGMVAKWTKNTANPIGRGAKIYNFITQTPHYYIIVHTKNILIKCKCIGNM